MSADPLGAVDGTNLFRYARNSPIVFMDPSGGESIHQVGRRQRYGSDGGSAPPGTDRVRVPSPRIEPVPIQAGPDDIVRADANTSEFNVEKFKQGLFEGTGQALKGISDIPDAAAEAAAVGWMQQWAAAATIGEPLGLVSASDRDAAVQGANEGAETLATGAWEGLKATAQLIAAAGSGDEYAQGAVIPAVAQAVVSRGRGRKAAGGDKGAGATTAASSPSGGTSTSGPVGGQRVYRALNEGDVANIEAGKPLAARGEGGTIAEHVAGKDTKYISVGSREGIKKYMDPTHGAVEIDVGKATSEGAGFVEHGNVIQGVERGGLRSKPRDLQNAKAAHEELFKGFVPLNAIVRWFGRKQ